ncbi:MAG: hypothetical protein ACLPOA_12110 [Methylocella sp.]
MRLLVAGLAFLAAVASSTADVMAKMLPLVDLITLHGTTFVFDRSKVVMVYIAPPLEGEPSFPGQPNPNPIHSGPPATHVLGIGTSPMPVKESPTALLERLEIADKFVVLTDVSGHKVWIKVTGVGWLSATYPGNNDPKVKCFVSVAGSKDPEPVIEDVSTVRKLIDDIRKKQDVGQ